MLKILDKFIRMSYSGYRSLAPTIARKKEKVMSETYVHVWEDECRVPVRVWFYESDYVTIISPDEWHVRRLFSHGGEVGPAYRICQGVARRIFDLLTKHFGKEQVQWWRDEIRVKEDNYLKVAAIIQKNVAS